MSKELIEVQNYKHRFTIGSEEIELIINCKNGYWTSEITKGETGTGGCCGGLYDSLESYIESQEKQHRYSFSFFKYDKT